MSGCVWTHVIPTQQSLTTSSFWYICMYLVMYYVGYYVYVVNSAKWRHNVQKCVMMSQSSWCQKYVITSKHTPWRQVCHDVKTCHDVKNTSWLQKVCHDVKNTSTVWNKVKIRHDVKKFVIKSKICHDVKKFIMHDIKNLSWHQKVCYDIKNTFSLYFVPEIIK